MTSALPYILRNVVWSIDCVNHHSITRKQYTYLLTYSGTLITVAH